MMEAGVPGILSKVAVIMPPLTEPTYMEIKRTSAEPLSIEKVSGKVNAINIAPVRPGIAPMTIPSEVPSAIKANDVGVARN